MKSFQSNHQPTFLDFVKDITDILIARQVLNIQDDDDLRTEFPEKINKAAINTFSSLESIQFFPGIVCFHCNPEIRNLGLLDTMTPSQAFDRHQPNLSVYVLQKNGGLVVTFLLVWGGLGSFFYYGSSGGLPGGVLAPENPSVKMGFNIY